MLTEGGRDRLFGKVHGAADQVIESTERLTADERLTVGRFLDDVAEVVAPSPDR